MDDLAMYNRFTAKPGGRPALVRQLLRAAELMRPVDGCRIYLVNEAVEVEDNVWVTEVWTDEASHKASLDVPEVRRLVAETMPLLAGAPEQVRLRPAGGSASGTPARKRLASPRSS